MQKTLISRPLRLWMLIEVFFGVGAVISLGLSPAESQINFAWPIRPVVMAAVLGAFYIASAMLFLPPLFAKRWEMMRAMVLPTALFSTVQTAATVLHWDKFSVGTLPFYAWLISYILPPPIFLLSYWWHQRQATSQFTATDQPLPAWLRTLLIGCGSLLTLAAILAFFVPSGLIDVFPWTLTPLTARSLSGWWFAVGGIMLAMWRENDRTRVRLAASMFVILLPALLLQMLRYANEVRWASPTLWLGLAFFAIVWLIGLYLVRGSWRAALR